MDTMLGVKEKVIKIRVFLRFQGVFGVDILSRHWLLDSHGECKSATSIGTRLRNMLSTTVRLMREADVAIVILFDID